MGDPEGGDGNMRGAARKQSPLVTMSRALVKAVARLDPDVAVARLTAYHAAEKPGLRKRALLAARIELIRKAMEAPPKPVVVEVPPEPVVEPPPPVVIVPPKPLSKGTMTMINLDDVAKMLMASPPEEASSPEPEAEAPAGMVAMSDVNAAFAALDWGDTAEQVEVPPDADAALWSELGGGGASFTQVSAPDIAAVAPSGMGQGGAGTGAADLASAFAALDGLDEAEVAEPVPAKGMDASFALLGELDPDTGAQEVAGGDLASAFAALDGLEEAEVAEPVPAKGMNAAFALLGELEPDTGAQEAAGGDLASAFAALEGLEEAEAAEPVPANGMDAAFALLGELEPDTGAQEAAGGDLASAFAALDGLEEAEVAEPVPAKGMDAAFALLGELEPGDAPAVGEEAPALPDGPSDPAVVVPQDAEGEPLSALQLAMQRLAAKRAAEGPAEP